MNSKLRVCSVCHKNYRYCPQCQEDQSKPAWYFAFCSENCRNIYDAASNFEDGRISINTAKEKLNKLDLSNMDNFGESYKKTISRITNALSVTTEVKRDEIKKVTEDKERTVYSNSKVEEKGIKRLKTKKSKNVEQ